MARVFIDGFEAGNGLLWDGGNIDVASYFVTGAATYGGSGIYHFNGPHGAQLVKEFTTDYTSDLYFSMRVYCTYPQQYYIFYLYNTDLSAHVYIRLDVNAGTLHAQVIVEGLATYEGTLTLTTNQPYRIELRYKPHASNGIIQLKVNGILDIDKTGIQTTTRTTNIAVNRFIIQCNHSSPNHTHIDDIIVDDAAWVGNTRIQGVTPSADTTCAWTAVPATNHYANINEIPWRSDTSDAEYVHTDATGIIDLFTATNLVDSTSQPIISVKSVQISTRAKLVGDATNVPHLKLGVQPAGSGTIYYSSNHNVQQDTWDSFTSIWSTNPAGGNWDMTTVNNMNIAIKSEP